MKNSLLSLLFLSSALSLRSMRYEDFDLEAEDYPRNNRKPHRLQKKKQMPLTEEETLKLEELSGKAKKIYLSELNEKYRDHSK